MATPAAMAAPTASTEVVLGASEDFSRLFSAQEVPPPPPARLSDNQRPIWRPRETAGQTPPQDGNKLTQCRARCFQVLVHIRGPGPGEGELQVTTLIALLGCIEVIGHCDLNPQSACP